MLRGLKRLRLNLVEYLRQCFGQLLGARRFFLAHTSLEIGWGIGLEIHVFERRADGLGPQCIPPWRDKEGSNNMLKISSIAAALIAANTATAQDSVYVLGKSAFGAHCAVCHGEDANGAGDIAELFRTPPSDLTQLASTNGGAFPFSEVYTTIAGGMGERAHGDSKMPIWGDFFLADSLDDRGVNASDAEHIVQGRILSLVYYLESIQQ